MTEKSRERRWCSQDQAPVVAFETRDGIEEGGRWSRMVTVRELWLSTKDYQLKAVEVVVVDLWLSTAGCQRS